MTASSKDRLLGRQAELRLLDDAAAELHAGTGAVVQVVGEPGIGKTCLLAELRRIAETRNCLHLGGRALEFERPAPFGVFVDALDDHLAELGAHRPKVLGSERLKELGAIFPSISELAPPHAEPLQQERYRAYYGVRTLLERLAGIRPLVLALDDLHWADESSAELIAHLVRRQAKGVLLALSFRPRRVPPLLTAALAAARRRAPPSVSTSSRSRHPRRTSCLVTTSSARCAPRCTGRE